MIDGLEWNGAPSMTEAEVTRSLLQDEIRKNTEYICHHLGIKTPQEIEREQWEKDNFFDKETQTTRKMRLEAIVKTKEPICCNINDELVYIGDCPDVQEYMKEHNIE